MNPVNSRRLVAPGGSFALLIHRNEETSYEEVLDLLGPTFDRVHQVRESEDALRRFANHAPDVVVLDLGLEGNDPKESLRVLTALREVWPDTPIIVVTSFGSIEDGVVVLQQGAFDYVDRTIEMGESWCCFLTGRVKLALKFKRTHVQI